MYFTIWMVMDRAMDGMKIELLGAMQRRTRFANTFYTHTTIFTAPLDLI
jgi:hypothetical protein